MIDDLEALGSFVDFGTFPDRDPDTRFVIDKDAYDKWKRRYLEHHMIDDNFIDDLEVQDE